MSEGLKEIVISREEAVFWMDAQGRWCNAHGPFEHPRIIAYFNRSIRRDGQGYFVEQSHGQVHEKVYFRYADTPLFAVDTVKEGGRLVMNTGEQVDFKPEDLFVESDQLYLRRGEDRIRFSERVLVKLSDRLEAREQGYAILADGVWRPIAESHPASHAPEADHKW